MSKSTVVVESEIRNTDSSYDDVSIAIYHSIRSIFQKRMSLSDNEALPKELEL
jgi:hypothetical protein